jgi:uncharacterized protein YhaN
MLESVTCNEECETTILNKNKSNMKNDENALEFCWNGARTQHECSSFQCQTIFKQLIEQQTHFSQVSKEKEKLQNNLNDLTKKYEETKCALKVIYQGTKTTLPDRNEIN